MIASITPKQRSETLSLLSSFRFVARILSVLWALILSPLSLLLSAIAEFPRGSLFGCLALFTALLPLVMVMTWKHPRWMPAIIAGTALWLALLTITLAVAPDGRTPPDSRVAHVFAATADGSCRGPYLDHRRGVGIEPPDRHDRP